MGLHHGQANFVTYGKPSLFLDFANKKSLTDRISGNNLITFTRSSTGTYVGADGLIKTAAANEPRFDHNPVTGESLGLLIEESRANLFTQSLGSQHSNINGVSVLNDDSSIIAPDGTTTATRYTPTSPSSFDEHSVSWEFGDRCPTISYDTEYIVSYFVKPDPDTIAFDYGSRVTSHFSPHQLYFKTAYGRQRGKVYDRNSTTESTSAFAIPYPNDWWRVYARVFLSGTGTYTFRSGMYLLYDNGSGTSSSWTATELNQSNGRIWFWGWQLEQGSFPTSYIPTSGSTVTRSADRAVITGTNFSNIYNSSEGTLYLEAIGKGVGNTGSNATFQVDDGFFNNRITLTNDDQSTLNSLITVSGTQTNLTASPSFTTGVNKNAIAYKSGDNANSLNGSTVVTNSSIVTLPIVDRFRLGSNADGNSNNTIKRAIYYPTRLTNAQLQSLTT